MKTEANTLAFDLDKLVLSEDIKNECRLLCVYGNSQRKIIPSHQRHLNADLSIFMLTDL